jgi:hypothetical protein
MISSLNYTQQQKRKRKEIYPTESEHYVIRCFKYFTYERCVIITNKKTLFTPFLKTILSRKKKR